MMDAIRRDVAYALRLLWRSPVFALTAALSLAIGIGANTTIFAVASALLLRPLPGLSAPDRLVDLGRTTDGNGFDTTSYPNYRDIRERTTTLSGVYAIRVEPSPISLGGDNGAERIYGCIVSGNYYSVLGVQPAAGRMLQDADEGKPGERAVVVVSHELWTRRFGGDPAIVGRTILLNGTPFAVVGVAPRGFQGTTLLKPDVWVPASMIGQAAPAMPLSLLTSRDSVWIVMAARLKPGVTIAQAQAEMTAISAALEREHPDANRGRGIKVAPIAVVFGETTAVAGFLALLMAICSLVLLIACVNVAGMLLARATGRRREVAVRLAIGAGRRQLVAQFLTESVVLFAVGGLIALIMTRWLTAALLALLPELPVPVALDVPFDWRVTTFAIGISFIAALASGLAPALQASRFDVAPALKADGLDSGPSKLRMRNVFVIGQVAMSLLLVIAAGLFFRALGHAASIPAGFDERRVDVLHVDLALAGYKAGTAEPFVRNLLQRASAIPGVESTAVARDLPLDGGRFGLGPLYRPGQPDDERPIRADWNIVTPGYFRTLKLPLSRGRDFADTDTATAPAVAIVNEAFAKAVWPDREALGQRLEMIPPVGDGRRTITIVGVTTDARLVSIDAAAEPFVYVPFEQYQISGVALLVRRSSDASSIPAMRALIKELNPNLPVSEALTLSDVTALGLVPQRVAAAVAGSLGTVGLLLAAIGIYGVTAYAVSRRTREIGIRIALGADSPRVLRLVLRQGLILATIGVAIGAVVAAVASRFIESLLFGISGLDPLTFGVTAVVFAAVALLATYLPARRALQVDPIQALRAE